MSRRCREAIKRGFLIFFFSTEVCSYVIALTGYLPLKSIPDFSLHPGPPCSRCGSVCPTPRRGRAGPGGPAAGCAGAAPRCPGQVPWGKPPPLTPSPHPAWGWEDWRDKSRAFDPRESRAAAGGRLSRVGGSVGWPGSARTALRRDGPLRYPPPFLFLTFPPHPPGGIN